MVVFPPWRVGILFPILIMRSEIEVPHDGGDVSSVLVRDSPPPSPPSLPALLAILVAKGQQLLATHMVAPKAPENFFSFPLPILSTLHPNIILEPNLDSNAHPNPQPTPNPTPKPFP